MYTTTTTITVNGLGGSRFLSILGAKLTRHLGRLGPALAPLLDGRADSVEVDTNLAEEVADFVERLLAEHTPATADDPPLLFSPNVGDSVAIVRDALCEFQAPAKRAPRIWRLIPRGTRGRVIAHQGETDRVLLEPSREIAFVRPRSMTGMRFWSGAPR
jgi:hypothetical protein